jgi:hypothetical protein
MTISARPSGAVPQIGAPQADQLAEHLADLRCGDEIATLPEWIARGIIMRVRRGHELCDRDRPGERDGAREPVG